MANLSIPPLLAWPSMPREFVSWFVLQWKALVETVAAIQGANTAIGSLQGTVNINVTNLSTLQTQINGVSTAQGADATNITALQTRATADEALIAGCATKAANLSDLASAAAARTNLGLGSGFSGTVALTKLTTGGANGSLTISNGIITAVSQPS